MVVSSPSAHCGLCRLYDSECQRRNCKTESVLVGQQKSGLKITLLNYLVFFPDMVLQCTAEDKRVGNDQNRRRSCRNLDIRPRYAFAAVLAGTRLSSYRFRLDFHRCDEVGVPSSLVWPTFKPLRRTFCELDFFPHGWKDKSVHLTLSGLAKIVFLSAKNSQGG
jgi:hypothetical protein